MFRELVIDVRVMGVTSRPCEKERMSGIEKIVSNSVHNMLILTNYPRLAITLTLQVGLVSSLIARIAKWSYYCPSLVFFTIQRIWIVLGRCLDTAQKWRSSLYMTRRGGVMEKCLE